MERLKSVQNSMGRQHSSYFKPRVIKKIKPQLGELFLTSRIEVFIEITFSLIPERYVKRVADQALRFLQL